MTRNPSRSAIAVAASLIVAVALAACSSTGAGPSAAATGSTASSAPSAAGATGLEGTLWRLTGYVGADGKTVAVPDAIAASATFAEKTLSGHTGCNDYTGGYTVDGDKLTIGPLATTKKACGPAETVVESAYLAALGLVAAYAISGDTLELKTAAGKAGLSFTATQAAGLTKTRWVATGVNNGKGAVSSVVAETTLTAIFAEAGTVAGSGGCNDYNGPYTSDATTIKIGPLASTRMACATPAGVSEQETAFLAALSAATKWSVTGSTLELRDDAGALQVSFRATLGSN
jgi:heat shock protein HslJ